MPRDSAVTCRKRLHSDGLDGITPSPKRLVSVSESQPRSSIESVSNSAVSLKRLSDSAHDSSWNFSSAVITSDGSASMCAGTSAMSVNVVKSRPSSSVFKQAHACSDASSYSVEALQSIKSAPFESSRKDIWMYRSPASKLAERASDSEYSEITHAHKRPFLSEPKGKVTHVISRREKSSLNSKKGADEDRLKDASESIMMLQEKWWERKCSLLRTGESKGLSFPSMTFENGRPCTTSNIVKDIKSPQGIPFNANSDQVDVFLVSSNNCAMNESIRGSWIQARNETLEFCSRRRFRSEADLPSSLTKGKSDDSSPFYVLSSGRVSVEEEVRLGCRNRTIDHDFEEFFSSLMLQ